MGLTIYHNVKSKRLPGSSLIRIALRKVLKSFQTFWQAPLEMPKARLSPWESLYFNQKFFNFMKVHLTPKFFFGRDETVQHSHKEFIIWPVSGIFKGFKNWQKVAEICYQLDHDRVSRGLAPFSIWRHRLIYMALTLCEHACKTVCDVKSRIGPCPSPAQSWDKEYQISGCTVARKNFRCCEKMLSRFWNSFKFAFLRK